MASSSARLDALVLQHLQERGFSEAASCLQKELAPAATMSEPPPSLKAEPSRPALMHLLAPSVAPAWERAYATLREWVHGCLDGYQLEMREVIYPFFAYCYLELVQIGERGHAAAFFERFHQDHALLQREQLNLLSQVTSPELEQRSEYVQRLRSHRYVTQLSVFGRALLVHFLQKHKLTLLLSVLNDHMTIEVRRMQPSEERGPTKCGATHARGVCDGGGGGGGGGGSTVALWEQLEEGEIKNRNVAELELGELAAVVEKHKLLAEAYPSRRPPPPAEAPSAAGRKHARKGKAAKDAVDAEDEQMEDAVNPPAKEGSKEMATAYVEESRVPLPPLADKVEKDFAKDESRRALLDSGALPSAWIATVHNASRSLCCVAFSADCATLACGHADAIIRVHLLRAAHRKAKKTAAGAKEAAAETAGEAAKASDAKTAKAAAAAAAADAPDDELAFMLRGHSGPVYAASFSRDDYFLVSCSQDGTARLWGLLQRACLVRYEAHAAPVWGVSFAPHGGYFATCSHDRTLRLWNTKQVQPVRIFTGHLNDVRCAAFHPNMSLIASGSDDAAVRVWDVTTAKCVRLLCREGHTAAVSAIEMSHRGDLLASAGEDAAVLLWRLSDARLLRRLSQHARPVWALSFSREDTQLLSAGADCTLVIWDVTAAASDEPPPRPALGEDESEEAPTPFLLSELHTKSTPLLFAKYSRTNLVVAAGVYRPPPQKDHRQ